MEFGEEGRTTMRSRDKKLTIEDYLFFMDNRDHQLTSAELRQIIGMHGYKRKGIQKSILIDALKSMDLMDICRSTLQDGGVSGDACLKLKEVIDDLNSIQWNECHVTSVITQGAAAYATTDRTVSVKRKKSKGLGKKAVEDDSVISTTCTTVAAKGTAASMKRKKSKGLGIKAVEVAVAVAVDQSINSTTGTTVAAGGTIVSVNRKRPKGLGNIKKLVDAVAADPTNGTTVAAGSTTVSVVRETPDGFGKKLTCGCC